MSSNQQQLNNNSNNENNKQTLFHDLCERCKLVPPELVCPTCQPFHKFCKKCDTIIHTLSIKISHNRFSIKNSSQTLNHNNHNCSPKVSYHCECHSARSSSNKTYEYSPPINNINNSNSNNNISTTHNYTEQLEYINIDTPPLERKFEYSKEYVLELKAIHQEEKNEMQQKINALQNHIERLKLNFQTELDKLQEQTSLIESKNKFHEEELSSRTNTLLLEKDSTIQNLLQKNQDLSNQISILMHKIEDLKKIASENSESYNNQIQALKNEISKLKHKNTSLQSQSKNQVQDLVQSTQRQINKINEQHKNEMNNVMYDSRFRTDKLKKELQNNLHEIQTYKNEKANLKQAVTDLTEENKALAYDNNYLRNNIEQLNFYADNEKLNNDALKKEYEKIRKEILEMKKDFDYLERTIHSLKDELKCIQDSNDKKDKDYHALLMQSEKIRKDAQDKIFEVSLFIYMFT
jgi:chromosome segregation ATPase